VGRFSRRGRRLAEARVWLPAVLKHADVLGPGVHHVEVRHDDWCSLLSGGVCDCAPDVESGARMEKKYG